MTTRLAAPATNIPRCGTITAVYYAPSKKEGWGDQIKIIGYWEQEGDGHFYLSIKTLDAFTDAGVVRQDPGTDNDGHPRFAVVNTDQRVMIVRKEVQGQKAKRTEVQALDVQGNVVTLPASPKPVIAKPAPAPVAAAAPAAPVAAAAPAAPPTPANGQRAQPSPEELKERMRERWAEIDEQYAACLAISAYQQSRTFAKPLDELDASVVQAGAATVMIQAERQNLSVFPGLAKSLLARLNGKKPAQAKPEREKKPETLLSVGTDPDADFDDDLPF